MLKLTKLPLPSLLFPTVTRSPNETHLKLEATYLLRSKDLYAN